MRIAHNFLFSAAAAFGVRERDSRLLLATTGGFERRQGTVAERIASYRLHEGGVGVACCEVVCNTVVTLVRLRPHNDTKRVMHEKVS